VDYIEHANNNTLKTLLALKYIFSVDWNGHYPEYVKILFDSNEFKYCFLYRGSEKTLPDFFGYRVGSLTSTRNRDHHVPTLPRIYSYMAVYRRIWL
jgi:hypothetical protein